MGMDTGCSACRKDLRPQTEMARSRKGNGMKKIKSVFQRNYETDRLVRDEVVPGCEWVLAGEGVPTVKFDGSCCAIIDGKFYKRYDAKRGKTPPVGFIPAQEEDQITGHRPGWVEIKEDDPASKWFCEARKNAEEYFGTLSDGTYEAIGIHFQGNAERLDCDTLVRHGALVLGNDIPRSFEGLRDYLKTHYIEGIVFHRENGDMAKIKRVDFGFEWNGKTKKQKEVKRNEK